MGIYDRDYGRYDYQEEAGGGRAAMPPMPPVVKYILIVNVAVYLAEVILFGWRSRAINPVERFFAVYPDSIGSAVQLWRVISYQFLHSVGDVMHIFWNMLGLYFFGPVVERLWGGRRFLLFYLCCGAVGGVLYSIMVLTGMFGTGGVLIGASGAVLGTTAACAILFPNARVLVMFIFPMRLVWAAGIIALLNIVELFAGSNTGGAVAHLGGMAAGVCYTLYRPVLNRFNFRKKTQDTWQKKLDREKEFEAEVDRILEKVHISGIGSLNRKEKKTLEEATRREQAIR